ncbi:MAG: putative DNA binding domain-containing protein [Candidatus Cloacimonetes bacterium]|nr:putative DNA binding domain-containing protein [Candidatus Cloacimonadota bacterium]
MILIEKIANGENKTLEFKEKIPSSESIAKTIIAFANTSGGQLIIGVNDKREITGLDTEDIFELMDRIASIIFDNCYPNIIPEIYTTNIDDKLLLIIEVFRGSLLPYYLKSEGKNNGTYIRIGATNRKAGYENILELERQKRNISFDEEADYDVDLINVNLDLLKKEFLKINKVLDHEKMLNMKLIKNENGKVYPTRGLLILVGHYENVRIKCSRFKGKTMDIFLDKKEYDEDVFSQLRNAESFILNHINIRAEIRNLQRLDIPEIPVEAIRETLVNAFVHRDYSNMGRDIKLGVYDDIVNIVSPGSFPNTILEEDILNGRSEIRNKVIARVFKELKYIEQWGSGIKRIKSYCLNSGLKEPLIQEKNDYVDVELYRKSDTATESGLKRPNSDRMEPQVLIIDFIRRNKSATKNDIKEMLKIKDTRTKEILNDMIKSEIIERKGIGRNTYYVLRDSIE